MAEKAITRSRLPSRRNRGLCWARCLVVTMEGFRFVEKWCHAEHGFFHKTRLYQPLLKLIRSKGVLATGFVRSIRRGKTVIGQALSSSYAKIVSTSSMLLESGREKSIDVVRWVDV